MMAPSTGDTICVPAGGSALLAPVISPTSRVHTASTFFIVAIPLIRYLSSVSIQFICLHAVYLTPATMQSVRRVVRELRRCRAFHQPCACNLRAHPHGTGGVGKR